MSNDKIILIDVSDANTFPKELEQLVLKKLLSYTPDIILKIKSKNIEYEKDVRIAIEEYLSPKSCKEEVFYNTLIALMDKYEFVLFHATKVVNKTTLMNGLNINDWQKYSALMESNCKILGMNETDIHKVLSLIKDEYERKYIQNKTKPNLSFFSGLELVDCKGRGYDQFCENIGGELAKWALEKEPILYKPLKEAGESFIVKFKIPFSNINETKKEQIAYQFITHYAARKFFNYEYNIEFDGMTHKNVSADNILEIIPCKFI